MFLSDVQVLRGVSFRASSAGNLFLKAFLAIGANRLEMAPEHEKECSGFSPTGNT